MARGRSNKTPEAVEPEAEETPEAVEPEVVAAPAVGSAKPAKVAGPNTTLADRFAARNKRVEAAEGK